MGDPIVLRSRTSRHKSKHLRTVVNTGALTIDEIQTAKGKRAYKFESRSKKYVDIHQLQQIKKQLGKIKAPKKQPKRKNQKSTPERRREQINAASRRYRMKKQSRK